MTDGPVSTAKFPATWRQCPSWARPGTVPWVLGKLASTRVAGPPADQVLECWPGHAAVPGGHGRRNEGAAEVGAGSLSDAETGELGQGQPDGAGAEDTGGQQREISGQHHYRAPPAPALQVTGDAVGHQQGHPD